MFFLKSINEHIELQIANNKDIKKSANVNRLLFGRSDDDILIRSPLCGIDDIPRLEL